MLVLSVSELKAQLSEHLRHVRQGEVLIITDRGRPVARIVPIDPADRWEDDLKAVLEAGQLRPGSGQLPEDLWTADLPADPGATVRQALRAEREEGW